MATSTIDANIGDNSILEDDNDPDLSLETGDDPVSDRFSFLKDDQNSCWNFKGRVQCVDAY